MAACYIWMLIRNCYRRNTTLYKLVSKTQTSERVFKFHTTESQTHKRTHHYLNHIEPQCILILRNVLSSGNKHGILKETKRFPQASLNHKCQFITVHK